MPGKPVFGHIDPDELTKNKTKEELVAVNIIKEKIFGRIKGRTYTNGSKQRSYLNNGETVDSPKVSIKALLTTIMIDAYKG